MPPTTPSSRNRTRQQPHPQDPPSPRHFIGRIDRSPFIFNTDQPLTETDRRWLRTGSIDEAQYDTDYNARDGFISDKKAEGSARVDVVVDLTSDEAGDSPSPASPSETSSTSAKSAWTRKQEVFLWKAQLRYGEGKEWEKVVGIVNKADPGHRTFTLWEIQEKWAELRREMLAL